MDNPSQEIFHTNKSLKTCLKPSSVKGESYILSPSSVTLEDDQSIVSNLSKSTFLSNTSSLTWPTFLADTEGDRYNGEEKEDGDHSIIYDKNKNKYKRITMKAKNGENGSSFENTLDRIFLHLYDAIVGTDALQISCANDNYHNAADVEEEIDMKNFAKLPAVVTELSSKEDAIFTHSNQTTFVSHEADNSDNDENLHFIPKCFTSSTSTEDNFLKMKRNSYQSSSLNMDGLTRSHSIINSHSIISLNEDDDENDPSNLNEKIQIENTEGPVVKESNETIPTAMVGSSSDQMPIDNYQSETKISTSCPTIGAPSLEETSSLEGIEVVDELGHIMDTHTQDVYVMYKIEDGQLDEEVHDDNVVLSQLQKNRALHNSSATNNTSTKKSQLFPSLRKMKCFSSRTAEDTDHSTKKDSNNTRITRRNKKNRNDNGRGLHRRNCDSPGGATTATLPSNSVGSSSYEVYEDDNSSFSSGFDINRTKIEI